MYIPDLSKAFVDELTVIVDDETLVLRRHTLTTVTFPSGQIVACDPFIFPETPPFHLAIAPGNYPVILTVAYTEQNPIIAFAMLQFQTGIPERWEMAIMDGQNPAALSEDEFYGYPVESGIGCFMDASMAGHIAEHITLNLDALIDTLREREQAGQSVWLDLALPEGNRCVIFESGQGDGVYPSYIGFDAMGHALCLVTDFNIL